jgi:hypothetical protein
MRDQEMARIVMIKNSTYKDLRTIYWMHQDVETYDLVAEEKKALPTFRSCQRARIASRFSRIVASLSGEHRGDDHRPPVTWSLG